MGDLINGVDRKAVIEAIHHYWFEKIEELPTECVDGYEVYADTKSICTYLEHNKNLTNIIKELPSAEPDWIPVSERLPEEEGWYLVTDDSGGWQWLEAVYYNPGDGLEPFWSVQNPVVWMRCPNPYKAGE